MSALGYRPCVGVVLTNGAGRVFAAERLDTPGAWQMPQGGIDPGETPRSAALRELHEETSVPSDAVRVEAETPGWVRYDLPEHLIGRVWGGGYRGQEQKWFLLRLHGPETLIDLDTTSPEFSAWAWMTPGAVLDAIVPFKRAVYAEVFEAFGMR